MLAIEYNEALTRHGNNSALIAVHENGQRLICEYDEETCWSLDDNNNVRVFTIEDDEFKFMLWNVRDIVELHSYIMYPDYSTNKLTFDIVCIYP